MPWISRRSSPSPPPNSSLFFRLRRYNGRSYEHTNRIKGTTFEASGQLRMTIPEPIWTWMYKSSSLRPNMKEQTPEPANAWLRTEVKDRWYVPDPNRATDLEKIRERALLKDFDTYRQAPQKTLRSFRLEAARAGFRAAWATRGYSTILAVADELPEEVLEEDSQLFMWYDQALGRSGAKA